MSNFAKQGWVLGRVFNRVFSKASVMALGCLWIASLAPAASASETISTHRSETFEGEDALAACERAAHALEREFPSEARALEVSLVDVFCEPGADRRYVLAVTYEHPLLARIATMSDLKTDAAVCIASLEGAREAFAAAGLPTVRVYCAEDRLNVDFIDPARLSTGELRHGPRTATLEACEAGLQRLQSEARAAGLFPLLGGCQFVTPWLDTDSPYFTSRLKYAIPLGSSVHAFNARFTESRDECELGLAGVQRRYARAGLPVLQAYCEVVSRGFQQVLNYVDGISTRHKTHQSGVYPTADRCVKALDRMVEQLTSRGMEVLHAYCQKAQSFPAESVGYLFRIHGVPVTPPARGE